MLQAGTKLGGRDEDACVEVFLDPDDDDDDDSTCQQLGSLNSGGRLQILNRLFLHQDHHYQHQQQRLLQQQPQQQDLMYHLEVIGEFQRGDAALALAVAGASSVELGLNSG